MLTLLIRLVLAIGVVVLAFLAISNRTPAAEPPPATAAPVVAAAAPAVPTPMPLPTATTIPFVEHIISRVARNTQEPYPTSTPLPQNIGVVSIVDFGYLPDVVRIQVGQSVSWTNDGQDLHDVTADTDGWYSGAIEPTTSFAHTFGYAGTFNYRCSIHLDMTGTVIVQS